MVRVVRLQLTAPPSAKARGSSSSARQAPSEPRALPPPYGPFVLLPYAPFGLLPYARFVLLPYVPPEPSLP